MPSRLLAPEWPAWPEFHRGVLLDDDAADLELSRVLVAAEDHAGAEWWAELLELREMLERATQIIGRICGRHCAPSRRPRWRSVVEGVSRAEVEAALPDLDILSIEPADTTGLGWPLNKTAPQRYRLRRPA